MILGNHRDAWVFGGIDATSGTALMTELTRVVMELISEGIDFLMCFVILVLTSLDLLQIYLS